MDFIKLKWIKNKNENGIFIFETQEEFKENMRF